ncbi:MAG: threonine ammonia-lyase, biosynthetic [Gammaproteobacteria bacterium]|nr:threonine ammonia-lyase, biosynthetic [Gammaproteobacteria bacterium]
MLNRYIEKILKARVYDVAKETPLEYAAKLSLRTDNRVWLKREDLQPVFSFKLRGAYNKIVGLSPAQRTNGVITASAGNHAQGVALSARYLGIKALIVMPKTTPAIKTGSVRAMGASIILHGDTYDEACEHAYKIGEEREMVFIHPYDDEEVIAGQGTVAMEILRQHAGSIHAIFVPVGGGGLVSGIAVYVKYLYPEIKIIGVEPEDAPCMERALANGQRTVIDQVGIFADGVAVRQVGKEPFRVARQYVDSMILVNTDEICAAIKDIFDDTRSIAEPAGALAVAGMKKYVENHSVTEKDLVTIVSGANINFGRLRHVAERAELGEQREALLGVTIPERAGSFMQFCLALGRRSITEFNYRYRDEELAHIFVGIELEEGTVERETLIAQLRQKEYPVVDLTENEMAKLHVRYMVGGRASGVAHEVIYRFEFPERPGALLRFLSRMGQRWSISMFHYRNHGSAHGRVLVGLQMGASQNDEFKIFLDDLGYAYVDETDNPAYSLYLAKTT